MQSYIILSPYSRYHLKRKWAYDCMKALRFRLSGKTAFFKKPEANSYYYFTYGHVHKVALLGMFGAILGYKGYTGRCEFSKKKLDLKPGLPEFYDKLQQIKVSIVPHKEKGNFPKKIQSFNNSVGYASQEQGGNLIVKEQWLEGPAWDIYVRLDCDESSKIAEYVTNMKCVYQPYLGKNDHVADIEAAEIVELEACDEEYVRVHSLAREEGTLFDEDEMDSFDSIIPFRYKEILPVGLDERTNLYEYDTFMLTNIPAETQSTQIYTVDNVNIVFH